MKVACTRGISLEIGVDAQTATCRGSTCVPRASSVGVDWGGISQRHEKFQGFDPRLWRLLDMGFYFPLRFRVSLGRGLEEDDE